MVDTFKDCLADSRKEVKFAHSSARQAIDGTSSPGCLQTDIAENGMGILLRSNIMDMMGQTYESLACGVAFVFFFQLGNGLSSLNDSFNR